jgi:hypothetical protein
MTLPSDMSARPKLRLRSVLECEPRANSVSN